MLYFDHSFYNRRAHFAQIKSVCTDVAVFDIVHDVETVIGIC